jgi:hypothetical protein
MDIFSTYRVVFSIVTDLDILENKAKERIREYIASEVERVKDEYKKVTFSNDRLKSGDRDVNVTELEQYNRETFIDSYLTLLEVTDEEITNTLTTYTNPEDIIFRILDNKRSVMKTKQVSMTLAGLLVGKE